MVVLDKQVYITKAQDLLAQRDTYRSITLYPTNKHKNKLINLLWIIKAQGGLGNSTYKRLSNKCRPQNSMASKIHKKSTLPTPIGSSRGVITCGVAKELASILSLLVGHSPIHIRNTKHFVDYKKCIRLKQGECISSYDVKTLFTYVPVYPAILFIKHKLQQDSQLCGRTSMCIQHITTLLELCLKHTDFFQEKYYIQVHSTAMGSPFSPM